MVAISIKLLSLLITKTALVIEKNALCLSQSAFGNFVPHVIALAVNGACYCLG